DESEMSDEEWRLSFARCLGVYQAGGALKERDDHGNPIKDQDFLLLLNAHHEEIPFIIPAFSDTVAWQVLLDTSFASGLESDGSFAPGKRYPLHGRSLALLTRKAPQA
ncbi:MAG: glycogen debranching enzyme GlgX, partial [Sulfuricellaceae bacterium]|nr:glycogen debranching enzyme GlgX [Sulfuricellaceae bacterium]